MLGGRVVGEVTLSITRSWVQNLSLPDERSNRETSRRIGFYSVYLVSLQGLPFTLLYVLTLIYTLHNFAVFLFFLFLTAIESRDVLQALLVNVDNSKKSSQL